MGIFDEIPYVVSSLKKWVKLKSNNVGWVFCVLLGYVEKNELAIKLATNCKSNSTESKFCCKLKFMPRGGRFCFRFFANRHRTLIVWLRKLSRSVSSISSKTKVLRPSNTVLSIWSSSGSKLMLKVGK